MPVKPANGASSEQRQRIAARVRAAMGYAGLRLDDIVERCDSVTAANIRRTVGARRDTPQIELVEIAAACDVPLSWLDRGEWNDNTPAEADAISFGEGSVEQRLLVVETYLGRVLRALDDALPAPHGAAELGSRIAQRDGQS
jgi:hypothetical protein